MVTLAKGERWDDLQVGNLKIIQNPKEYLFTSDAVLLADFARVKQGQTVCEFGSGGGIISILTAFKRKPKMVYGIEIQAHLADMSRRSAEENRQENVTFLCGDVKNAASLLGREQMDAVICNPPYRKVGSGQMQESETLQICRHEVKITLAEIIASAADVLKCKGALYMVHQAERFGEICYFMKQAKIEPKEVKIVCQKEGQSPNLVLVKGVKDGNAGLKWLPPLVVFRPDGTYTDQIKKIYGESYGG